MNEEAINCTAVLEALGLVGPPATVEPVGGEGTAVWRVEHGGRVYALRLFGAGQEQVCGREVAVMRAARAGRIPAPEVVAEGVREGRPVLLLLWCPGRTLAEEAQAHPERGVALAQAAGRVLARIHAVPPPVVLRE